MSFIKVWLHIVFGTKNREPMLSNEIRGQVITHIKEYAKTKDIYIKAINGYYDHLHFIIALSSDQSISKIVNLIKGESSHWINQKGFYRSKFSWSDEYFAASIGESQLNTVQNYINNQVEHHKVKSYNDECEEFLKVYGFKNQG